MAQTTQEIKKQITIPFMANSLLAQHYGFVAGTAFEDAFSKLSFENIIFDSIAYFYVLIAQLFDTHTAQIDHAIKQQKSGTANWYKTKALAFQYGFDLVTDSDMYDNTIYTDDQIEASKIVKYCAVNESNESNRLVIKVATEQGGILQPLIGDANDSFTAYMQEIKYAGVKIAIVNNPADKLRLQMVVYRDPLVLYANGSSILNADKPVETAIKNYMKALPFNGELVLNDLIFALKQVPGVVNAHIINASASAYDTVTQTYLDYQGIYVKTIPSAGYFEIENFDQISYVV